MMHLVAIPNMAGGHLGGWRHPDALADSVMNLDAIVDMARTAEAGKFDAVFLADGNGVRAMDQPTLFAAISPPRAGALPRQDAAGEHGLQRPLDPWASPSRHTA